MDIASIFNQIPDFSCHEEARNWFQEQFPGRFLLRSNDVIEGKRVFFYHLIKDLEDYQQYMESFANPVKHEIRGMEPFESYSTVEISEDGEISFSI